MAAVDRQICDDWKEKVLLERYDQNDIYNADEKGLYWQTCQHIWCETHALKVLLMLSHLLSSISRLKEAKRSLKFDSTLLSHATNLTQSKRY